MPEDVQAQLRQRAEQEGGPVSATASVRFSHDLATRDTDSRVSLPKRPVAERAAALAGSAKDARWEQGGLLSGALNPKYQKIFGGLREQRQEQQQQSRANRRRGGGRRRDDLKDSGFTMPQIVIEKEPLDLRR